MTDTTQAIRDALAAGPTPGPWHHKEWGSLILDGGTGSAQVLVATVAVNTRRDEGRHNAAFITACHPEAITALLAELDAARDGIEAAVLAGRERCANVCDAIAEAHPEVGFAQCQAGALLCKKAIREGVKS